MLAMLRVESPVIAVNGELVPGDPPRVSLACRYADAVLKAGGVPVIVPAVGGPGDARRLLERVDGLLLSGGDDFDTRRLGLGPTHPAAKPVPAAKQDFDLELVHAALELRLPVLGICYGMQLLALAEGGRLHQHLPDDRPGSQDHTGGREHPVRIEPGSKLAALMGLERVEVVSRHHQAVAGLGGAWRVSAVDDEDLIEAIERADHPFALGVQWHPEQAPEGSAHDRLFRGLVEAARIGAARGVGLTAGGVR
jgi:gamma-glutamyl-gamma-aminobutyrate hydrolase PuuD